VKKLIMPRFLLVPLAFVACTTASPIPDRNDDPDLAAEYHAMKRAGSNDPLRSLHLAREQMRRMSIYSTSTDALLDDSVTRPLDDPLLGRWKFLGPGNIGGRTRVLVIDPVENQIMYTAGVSGGIWKSRSAGARWTPIGDDLANIAVNALVMHPANRNVLYAGTGEGYFREIVRGTALPLRGDGIYVTRDAGETWRRLASTATQDFQWVNDLVVSTHDPSRVYAATRTGVFRSDDEGETWTRTLSTDVTGGCLDLAYRGDTEGDYLFASCGTFAQATVWRARHAESDAEWEAVLSEANMGRTTLAIAPSNPSIMYALAASNEPGDYNQGLHAVYRSTAGGDAGSWEARVTNDSQDYGETLLLTNPLVASWDLCVIEGQRSYVTMGWYCNTIAVDPVNPDRVFVGGVDLFRSDDGGSDWGIASYWWTRDEPDTTYLHADQHAIVFHPRYDGASNRTVYFTNDGGIYRTDDSLAPVATGPLAVCSETASSMTFVPLNNSYGVTQFYHGAVSPDGRWFLGGTQDNGTLYGSIDDGPNGWRRTLGGDGGYVAIDPLTPAFAYAESQNGNMAFSLDGGRSFRRTGQELRSDQFLFITPFALDPNEPSRLWIGGRTMWLSRNRAQSWSQRSALLPAQVSAIAVKPGAANVVLAGTASGHIARTERALATVVEEWSHVKPRDGFVSSLVFDPSNTNIVYATYAGFGGVHLWKSTDGGRTWAPRNGNLPDMPVHSIAIDPTNAARLYLGTDLGVLVSLDGGESWSVENTGFANAVTEHVVIAQGVNGPAIYAFTHGRGAWRAELTPHGPRRRAVRR
jgi:photosystem II stability/assembly factor-like uncharacterized protein